MKKKLVVLSMFFLVICGNGAYAAYFHMGEADAPKFQQAYPDLKDSKLDDCTLCHQGGSYVDTGNKTRTLGTCQWCHYTYGYDASGDITKTINPYGKDYLNAGRSVSAFASIESKDSDGDTYTNKQEIAALAFPGDPEDNPGKVPAPRITYSLDEIKNNLPRHKQFLLMNTNRAGDWYAEYEGVPLYDLLIDAGMDEATTTGVAVFSPDGFSYVYDLKPGGASYYVKGTYPPASFYYDVEADKANGGWCNYTAPSCRGRQQGDKITVDGELQLILAYLRDGADLVPGYLDEENKLGLDSEGPFRTVVPQIIPGPPDQLSTAATQDVVWPYDRDADHNAGFSERAVVAIRVEPLPEGTADFNWYEGGWGYVDDKQVIIYGNLAHGTISGTVKDAATQNPIEKATVTADKGGYSARTDAAGIFTIPGVVVGSYTLTVYASDYQTRTGSVTVAKDETEIADFSLTAGSDTTCPAESVAGADKGLLALLRSYRDRVLSRNSLGKQYTTIYYIHAAEMTSLAIFNKAVREKLAAALYAVAPSIRASLQGGGLTVNAAQRQKIIDCIQATKKAVSPQLKAALALLEKNLGDGTLAAGLGIAFK